MPVLYRELPLSAQTAYAELFERVQVAEATRSPAFLSGKIGWKTIKGKRYAYWAFKEIDGRKREYYLGPEGPAIAEVVGLATVVFGYLGGRSVKRLIRREHP